MQRKTPKRTCERYQNFSEARERYQNYCVEQEQNLLEYMRNYYVTHKNNFCIT